MVGMVGMVAHLTDHTEHADHGRAAAPRGKEPMFTITYKRKK
jgi:hypothetical protein